jgi:transcriptional regulator with XRE-family HTH domain
MSIFEDMTTGDRIAFLRERRKMKQNDFAQKLGINNVYASQFENDVRPPGRTLMRKIARLLDTSIGFLECEIDDPAPPRILKARSVVYVSLEAEEAARLIDRAPDEERARMLAVLRAMATRVPAPVSAHKEPEPEPELPQRNEFARRLVASENVPAHSGRVRVWRFAVFGSAGFLDAAG